MVKPTGRCKKSKRTAGGTLPFGQLRLAHVGQKTGMRRTNFKVVAAGLRQAELAVHRETYFRRIGVFLAVVFPPTDRAQTKSVGRFKGLVTATGTAESGYGLIHGRIDGEIVKEITVTVGAIVGMLSMYSRPDVI